METVDNWVSGQNATGPDNRPHCTVLSPTSSSGYSVTSRTSALDYNSPEALPPGNKS